MGNFRKTVHHNEEGMRQSIGEGTREYQRRRKGDSSAGRGTLTQRAKSRECQAFGTAGIGLGSMLSVSPSILIHVLLVVHASLGSMRLTSVLAHVLLVIHGTLTLWASKELSGLPCTSACLSVRATRHCMNMSKKSIASESGLFEGKPMTFQYFNLGAHR